MNRYRLKLFAACLLMPAGPEMLCRTCLGAECALCVSPAGDDRAAGSQQAPFRTLARAQQAARAAAKEMRGDVIVNLGAGEYRLDRTLEFTAADSGRNGFRVIYRSAAGPGKARLVGSKILAGWQPYRHGIWQADLPPQTVFHTLYEGGQRVHKARFPDLELDSEKPTALGRYLVTVDGSPIQSDKNPTRAAGPGWLTCGPEDVPPVTAVTKMRIHIFARGKCDWVREIHPVTGIDPQARRLTMAVTPVFGIGAQARFFLEDELGLLDAPGEFFVDEKAHTLYYKPLGTGHPDKLGISYPTLKRMIQFQGKSRDACVENIVLDGLALEETDNTPPLPLWAYAGLGDGAVVWMNNAARIEVRNCHLSNGGRHGILLIGHNVENRVTGCWIEHMGVNGVSLCNRFLAPDKKGPTLDRCEGNRIHNTWISHVGELHTYAECVTAFNVSHNEVDHCRLDNSVRYAITLRGNTGPQYGPPISTNHPPTKGNRFHHISVSRCGQDGGDMGALHAAGLNNPGGGCVNTFEQITVADTAAIPSVKDIPPAGIFLDWPKMAMDQVFRNVEIVRSQGKQLCSHGVDNGASARTENVSWQPGFREERMDYANIGLTAEFPAEFGGRPARRTPLAAPGHLRARAVAHDQVTLGWNAAVRGGQAEYLITRDGREIGRTSEPRFVDRRLRECTAYRYRVAARRGDFTHFGPAAECSATTPADRQPPVATGARAEPDGRRVRVAFSEPVDPRSACDPACYRFEPAVAVRSIEPLGPAAVLLTVDGYSSKAACLLHVSGICDTAAARNRMPPGKPLPVGRFDVTVRYAMDAEGADRLEDTSGGGGDAVLHGGATIQPGAGPRGGAALVLDGEQGWAEGPADLNLGPGDFTLALWIYREKPGVIVSKGNGFGSRDQWSFGLGNAPNNIVLRVNNQYFGTAEGSVKNLQWTHVAFVRRGREGRSYVNGQPSGGPHDLSVVGPLASDRALRIGRRQHAPHPMYFKGRVSGLTIWPRALTAEEIRAQASSP